MDLRKIVITEKGSDFDFVIRCLSPKYGFDEDPVTGSAFTQLVSYWSKKLDKNNLIAKQFSKRDGRVKCQHLD
ncbi:PhzF family phenazine biosynthesis protein [Candidatus Ruthia endofausta]|uniref:PhzF family phenazine biosynthesis protein n=1 Tax=Candidatus Ruthia endofausta TaxID=2738852 RepID=A0A6N0HP25_9GAMM|nr:PhzF family phenazine biosynthesis protein [Candidatus Ruthia endofausta]QKQ24118.1 PhzF family phenazine biosynthesis protein [Candidatus Ruthia endofausta]